MCLSSLALTLPSHQVLNHWFKLWLSISTTRSLHSYPIQDQLFGHSDNNNNNTTKKKKKKKSVILVTQPIASYHFMKFENILYFQGRCMFRRSKQPILSLVFSVWPRVTICFWENRTYYRPESAGRNASSSEHLNFSLMHIPQFNLGCWLFGEKNNHSAISSSKSTLGARKY